MQNYAGNSTNFPAYVRLPEGTDPRNATVAAAGLEDLADRTAHMYEILTAVPPNASEVVPLDLGSARAPAIGGSADSSWQRLWRAGINQGYNEIWSSSGYAADPLLIEATPSLLKPCRVTSMGIVLRGYVTDLLPTSLPRICLMRRSFFGGGFSGTSSGVWDEATANTVLPSVSIASYTSTNGIAFEVDCDVAVETIGQYCWALRVLSDVVQVDHGQGISVRVAWLRTQRLA